MADNIKYRFIQNVGDYFPSGYFSDDFFEKVQKCAGISNDEVKDICSPYVRLKQEYNDYKNFIINDRPRVEDAIKKTHDFHTRLLSILGYQTDHAYQEHCVVNDESTPVEMIPVRHVIRQGEQVKMLVMEMQNLIPIEEKEPAGLFEQQYESDERSGQQKYAASQWRFVFNLDTEKYKISPAIINKAITHIFLLPEERRPHFILMLAGNTVFLFDKDKWAKGSYLQFSLDDLFAQASIDAKHRTLYALFHMLVSKQTLAAEGEMVLMDTIIEESYKNAYEVTKDLKEGVILAVETLANEALYWWKQNNNIPVSDYTDDTFESEVKDDCLTIIYRLLFLFYAESRDELEILPVDDEVYKLGYSLESLRDLEMVRLNSDASRNGYFFDDSIHHLFSLLSDGHNPKVNNVNSKSFRVRPIDSPLFNDKNLHHLAGVRIRNIKWQEIIKALSLSKKKNYCGRISYANLGVNQLGSVYESLLAFRGFYAEEDYIEVHKANAPQDGTFLVPYSRMGDFDISEVLCDQQTGNPVILPEGTFVYRLNGRDRQKSASYYTPEVLTRSTVKYTLKSILDDVRANKRQATELLELKILEPAMGAAAFQNEVINQLAEAYLAEQQRQQREKGLRNWRIQPDHYRDELQKVKAYIATHNVYGVDLNPTAIELGKLSLWLNVIHKDMETPFFANRLALGNAVIGAWLKVYSKQDIYGIFDRNSSKAKINKWWEKAPHKVKFFYNRVNRSVNEVYHFLLPDANMLGVRSIKEQKKAHANEDKRMAAMLKDWTAPIGDADFKTLQRISGKIDVLLKEYFQFQQSIELITQNKKQIWGISGDPELNLQNYEEKKRLNDTRNRHDNAYFRLKLVMDYWCALWFWEYDDIEALPKRSDYWSDIEAMLNVSDEILDRRTAKALRVHIDKSGQLGLFAEGQTSNLFMQHELEATMVHEDDNLQYPNNDETSEIIKLSKEEILTKTKGENRGFFDDSERFAIVKKYADRYHFFHPMLEFLEVFWLRDGFDIICGNPPWLKLEFDEQGILSEKYPEVAIRKVSAPDVRKMRDKMFEQIPATEELYRSEEIDTACSSTFMNAYCNYPLLVGQQTNLYKCVLENAMDMASDDKGYIGLLTPESIYDDPKGQLLRRELYKRLRYHFQYQNELRLFAEVHHHTVYGDQLLGPVRSSSPRFASLSNLFHPSTVDACFAHDGHGVCGGIKDENGNWNTKPHRDRIVTITDKELQVLSDTFEDGTTGDCAKLVSLHSKEIIDLFEKLSNRSTHFKDYKSSTLISRGFEETGAVNDGIIKRETCYTDAKHFVYSGPHFYLANPINKNPRNSCKLNSDYDNTDLLRINDCYLSRTNYVPALDYDTYSCLLKGFQIGYDDDQKPIYDKWISYYKAAMRRMTGGGGGERTVTATILPSGTSHLHTITSVIFQEQSNLLEFVSLLESLTVDFVVKTSKINDILPANMQSFPMGVEDKYKPSLFARTLLLNCLTTAYSDLWQEMWDGAYKQETWSLDDPRLKPFDQLHEDWAWDIPLRNYFERRQALVEIDVIAAMALGLTLEDLEMIYTIQFPVLQQNEADTWYDQKGNIVFTCSKGLTGVGLDRKRNAKTGMLGWEDIRGEQIDENTYAGTSPTHTHTIDPAKSELYGGQQVTYYAPYTRSDRIEDYRRAWAHFERIFNK